MSRTPKWVFPLRSDTATAIARDLVTRGLALDDQRPDVAAQIEEGLGGYDKARMPVASTSVSLHLYAGAERLIHGHYKTKPMDRGPWDADDAPERYADFFTLAGTTVFVSDTKVLRRIAAVCRTLARKIERAGR